ncbi:MAG TPA: type VI secretion system contractile sheath large subunit [Gammaproteobacteria bacterium]
MAEVVATQPVERINLVYRSEASGEDVELPFRVLVMADFTLDARSAEFIDQEPVHVTGENLDAVLAGLAPVLRLAVEDNLSDLPMGSLDIELKFSSMQDFSPDNVVTQIPACASLIAQRERLINLRRKMDRAGEGGITLMPSAEERELIKRLADGGSIHSLDPDMIGQFVAEIDGRLSRQMDAVMHHPSFRGLEGAWRGLAFVLARADERENCRVHILNVSKQALLEEFEDVPEITQSRLYERVYAAEFGQFGGKPYSVIAGDYSFGPSAQDVRLLQQLGAVAAMAHAPFLAGVSPAFFNLDSWSALAQLRDVKSILEQPSFAKWNSFRASEDARYVGLALPGFLLREPYGATLRTTRFDYAESFTGRRQAGLWGNCAFALVTRMLSSFAQYRWCVNMTGQNDGRVVGLNAGGDGKIPTEVLIPDRREAELASSGFIPLSVHKSDGRVAFFSANSVQSVKALAEATDRDADIGMRLGAQLPYLMVICRIAHYVKMMQREHIGSWHRPVEIERELNNWLKQYVADMDNPAPGVRGRRPLRRAAVNVREIPGKSGWYLIDLSVTPHIKYMGSQFTLGATGKLDRK